jgi:hypothetical protein
VYTRLYTTVHHHGARSGGLSADVRFHPVLALSATYQSLYEYG